MEWLNVGVQKISIERLSNQAIDFNITEELTADNIHDDVLSNLPESLLSNDNHQSFFRPTIINCSNVHFTININKK